MSSSDAFILQLVRLFEQPGGGRAELAALRRGATGEARDLANVYPLVLPHVPSGRESRQQPYLDVACLFGLHPTKPELFARGLSLAQAMRALSGKSQSIEQRFVALLQCHREDLLPHLRHCVSLAKANDLPLRWTDVLLALRFWESERSGGEAWARTPQRRWAQEFWGPLAVETSAGAEGTPATSA
jgi:CRISPR system Cascade subunit CasB